MVICVTASSPEHDIKSISVHESAFTRVYVSLQYEYLNVYITSVQQYWCQ